MANHYFQFKQFKITQAHTAMKVSTDACIQGALFADFLLSQNQSCVSQILDIGAGTGLLSLMLAQANPSAVIDAVEMDEQAITDLKSNFENSQWAHQLHIVDEDFNQLVSNKKYDAIICNPPFFKNQLLTSSSASRLHARHDVQLNKEAIAYRVESLLQKNGSFCIMYPSSEWKEWETLIAKTNLHPVLIMHIHPNQQKAANRVVGIYTLSENILQTEASLHIYEQPGSYTPECKKLLSPYYLHL